MSSPKNNAASIKQRLLNKARKEKRPYNEFLQHYVMERFLYRLSCSSLNDSFILKGSLMLRIWKSSIIRPTKDIDMLGRKNNSQELILSQIQEIISTKVEEDGLVFDQTSVSTEEIIANADYKGVRVKIDCKLGTAKIKLQLDIGFGNVVYPEIGESDYPTLLELPSPHLLCYSKESAIAEKFSVMVKLGSLNSRIKDFYDIWLLAKFFDFDGACLAQAIRLTFNLAQIEFKENIEAFTESFIEKKQVQWVAFKKRLKLDKAPVEFADIVIFITKFLHPILKALSSQDKFNGQWRAGESWNQDQWRE